jgi:hypothetical protein
VVQAYYADDELDQEDWVLVNETMYNAYHDVYLANPSPLDLGMDSTSENELGGRLGAVDC